MARKLLVCLMALMMVFCACAPKEPAVAETPVPTAEPTATPAPALDKDVVILYTNDVHCAVDESTGYAGLAAYKAEMEAEGKYVVLVDAGDAIQGAPIGTLSKGSYLVDIMNEVGYDIAVPGNHEYDYGMENFLTLTQQAKYPYLSCNFVDKDGAAVLDAYKILDFNGIKIAFVGISTPKTITSSTPTYFQDGNGNYIYGFCQDTDGKKLYAAVQSAVDAAAAEGADYIIAVAHLGIEAECTPWMSTEVIANTTGIDAMIDGHSHSVIECERVKDKAGNRVLLTSTGTRLENIGMLYLTKDGSMSTGLVKGYAQKDAAVETYINNIKSQFDALLSTVVAKTDVDLVIADPATDVRIVRTAETNLGDLCADAYRAMSGADIAFVNGGGVRVNIAKGDITYNDIIKVHPFGNSMCVVEATGQQILDALEMGVKDVPGEFGGFLQVSGLTFEFNQKIPSPVVLDENKMFVKVEGERRVQNVLVGGVAIDPAKTYTLAAHNYMLKSGGDGINMFVGNTILQDEVMIDNQVLINYIVDELGGVVGEQYADPYGEGRIVAVG